MLRGMDRRQIVLVGVLAAWLGVWGAWIPAATSGLNQNIFMLAEWSTFLPGVRSGEIRLAPDILRLAAALGTCTLMFAAENIPGWWARWLVRLAAALPVFVVLLPPYPDLFQLWWSPSYGLRFGTASIVIAGLAASGFIGRLPTIAAGWAVILTGAMGIAAAVFALSQLIPPFQAAYAAPIGAGWGLSVFFGGLAISILASAPFFADAKK